MREPLQRAFRLLAFLAILILAPASPGQEFELGDNDEWVVGDEPDPTSPAGRLAFARRALAAGDAERAEFLATQWIDDFPDNIGRPEAHIIRGDALFAQREYYESLFDYEYVARSASGSQWFVTALERELEVARLFVTGTKRKFFGLRILSAEPEAEELLIRVQERLPGSRLAEEAAITLADWYFTRRKMDLAVEMYSIFIENFPRSEYVNQARKRLVYAHLASFKGPEFDAKGLSEARARLRELQAVSPSTAQKMGADALLLRIEDSEAEKRLATAEWYVRRNDFIAAELTVRRLLEKHPRSVAAIRAVRLGASLVDRLPPSVRRLAPDYTALAALIESGRDPDVSLVEEAEQSGAIELPDRTGAPGEGGSPPGDGSDAEGSDG